MRVPYYFLVLVSMLILVTAKPSMHDRMPSRKSTAVSQKYVLFKPISATVSYIYLAKQALLSSASPYITDDQDFLSPKANADHDTIDLSRQHDTLDNNSKNNMVVKSSSSAVDTHLQHGPVTALALVLFFCVLFF